MAYTTTLVNNVFTITSDGTVYPFVLKDAVTSVIIDQGTFSVTNTYTLSDGIYNISIGVSSAYMFMVDYNINNVKKSLLSNYLCNKFSCDPCEVEAELNHFMVLEQMVRGYWDGYYQQGSYMIISNINNDLIGELGFYKSLINRIIELGNNCGQIGVPFIFDSNGNPINGSTLGCGCQSVIGTPCNCH